MSKPDLDRASRLCWALWLFMWMSGHLAEGRRWVEQMLPQRATAMPDVRGRILLAAMVIGFGLGLRNRMIAERLVISEKTVQNHISNIFAKLQVNDRGEAMVWATQRHLTDHQL